MSIRKALYVDPDGFQTESSGVFETSDFVTTAVANSPILLNALGLIPGALIDDSDISHDSTDGAAASTVHTAFPLLDGTRDMTGVISYNSAKTFSNDQDLVSKVYVDQAIAGSGTSAEWQDSVLSVQTDATLDPTTTLGSRYIIEDAGALHANFGTINKSLVDDSAMVLQDDDIVEYSGGEFKIAYRPATGAYTSADDETTSLRYFSGSAWVQKQYESTTASLGCIKNGMDIQLDLLAAGGLKLTGNEVGIEPNDFAGEGLVDDGSDNMAIDWSTTFNDAKAIQASDLSSVATGLGGELIGLYDAGGLITATNLSAAVLENRGEIDAIEDNVITSTNGSINSTGSIGADNQVVETVFSVSGQASRSIEASSLASTANGLGSSMIGVEDSAGNFTATEVEGVLAELAGSIQDNGVTYTAGTGGADVGDVMYISGNDTASVMPINAAHRAIGVAVAAASVGTAVKVLANDTIANGALTGATAGDKYYWDGTTLTTTIPSGAGSYVWYVGVARNATDLHVELEFIKKNT